MSAIERTELMTVDGMIDWLKVLNDGYAKPDLSGNPSGTGTVRETKDFKPFIMLINSRLCELSGIECPDVSEFTEFKQSGNNNRRY